MSIYTLSKNEPIPTVPSYTIRSNLQRTFFILHHPRIYKLEQQWSQVEK